MTEREREYWEYRAITLRGQIEQILNEYGRDGWELVTVEPETEDRETYAYFKRRI